MYCEQRRDGMKKKLEFLEEYRKLCLKYGCYISACGCCGSPWVVESSGEDEVDDHIKHLRSELSGR